MKHGILSAERVRECLLPTANWPPGSSLTDPAWARNGEEMVARPDTHHERAGRTSV